MQKITLIFNKLEPQIFQCGKIVQKIACIYLLLFTFGCYPTPNLFSFRSCQAYPAINRLPVRPLLKREYPQPKCQDYNTSDSGVHFRSDGTFFAHPRPTIKNMEYVHVHLHMNFLKKIYISTSISQNEIKSRYRYE